MFSAFDLETFELLVVLIIGDIGPMSTAAVSKSRYHRQNTLTFDTDTGGNARHPLTLERGGEVRDDS